MTKNPFMSAYLSAANRVANTARGHATNEFNADANLMYGSVRLNRLPPDKLARCSEPLLCRRSEVKLGAATLPSLSISPFADNDQLCPTNSSTTALTAKSSDPAEQCSAPGRCRLLSAGSSSVGAACARGRGFDVEEYAQRIYRANINLVLAEVPRDYSKPAQAPDFWHSERPFDRRRTSRF